MCKTGKIGWYTLSRGLGVGDLMFWHDLDVCGLVRRVHTCVNLHVDATVDMDYSERERFVMFYDLLPGGPHSDPDDLFVFDEDG